MDILDLRREADELLARLEYSYNYMKTNPNKQVVKFDAHDTLVVEAFLSSFEDRVEDEVRSRIPRLSGARESFWARKRR